MKSLNNYVFGSLAALLFANNLMATPANAQVQLTSMDVEQAITQNLSEILDEIKLPALKEQIGVQLAASQQKLKASQLIAKENTNNTQSNAAQELAD